MRIATTWMVVLTVGGAWGQRAVLPVAPAPAGTVTGRVVCGDTRAPARFAEVHLMLKPEPGELEAQRKAYAEDKMPASSAPKLVMVDVRTGLDGVYRLDHVPVGEYYVVVVLGGYIFPVARVASEKEANDLDKVLAEVPQVRVLADKTAEANVTLERGASVAGRVLFDDGQPVVGAFVNVLPVEGVVGSYRTTYGPLTNVEGNLTNLKTDDEGRYRAVGLRPGKYLVKVSVAYASGTRAVSAGGGSTQYQSGKGAPPLGFYEPGVMHRKDAKPVEIKGSEAVSGVDVEVRLSGLHTLTGRMVAKEDGRPANTGRMQLKDESDTDFTRSAYIGADGTWAIEFLPAGTYTLTTAGVDEIRDPGAISTTFPPRTETVRHFQKREGPVTMLDHDQALEDWTLEEEKAKK